MSIESNSQKLASTKKVKKMDPSRLQLFYDKGEYAITITTHDKYQFIGDGQRYIKKDRMEMFKSFIHDKILSWPQFGIQYLLYIELSEPRDLQAFALGPRLHLHGIIKFCSKKSVRKFLMTELYMLAQIGRIEIDTIDDRDYWLKYCTKQQHIIMEDPLTSSYYEDSEDTEHSGS